VPCRQQIGPAPPRNLRTVTLGHIRATVAATFSSTVGRSVQPQRNHERRLVAGRDSAAVLVSPNGLHSVCGLRRSPQREPAKMLHPPQPYDGGKHQEDDKKKRNPLQFCYPLGSRGAGFQSAQASISRECDLAHTSPPGSSLSPA
jgi:hypothetical protein